MWQNIIKARSLLFYEHGLGWELGQVLCSTQDLEGLRGQSNLNRWKNLHDILHDNKWMMFHGLVPNIAIRPIKKRQVQRKSKGCSNQLNCDWLLEILYCHGGSRTTYYFGLFIKYVMVPQHEPLSVYLELEGLSITKLDSYFPRYILWTTFKVPWIFMIMALGMCVKQPKLLSLMNTIEFSIPTIYYYFLLISYHVSFLHWAWPLNPKWMKNPIDVDGK
jgi:hypothetical protein